MSAANGEGSSDPRQGADRLTEINHRIATAELRGDVEYLRGVLAEDLLFRRANGSIVDRAAYLEALPATKYEEVVAEAVELHSTGASAVATVRVRARGRRPDGAEFAGVFGNVRLFVPGGPEGWQCRVWINTPIA